MGPAPLERDAHRAYQTIVLGLGNEGQLSERIIPRSRGSRRTIAWGPSILPAQRYGAELPRPVQAEDVPPIGRDQQGGLLESDVQGARSMDPRFEARLAGARIEPELVGMQPQGSLTTVSHQVDQMGPSSRADGDIRVSFGMVVPVDVIAGGVGQSPGRQDRIGSVTHLEPPELRPLEDRARSSPHLLAQGNDGEVPQFRFRRPDRVAQEDFAQSWGFDFPGHGDVG